MECRSQVLDELTEVDTFVGNIIENGFLAVALILYVANLHLQTQPLGNLTALNHRRMLALFGFLVLVHIDGTSQTIDTADVFSTLQIGFLDLHVHQTARQRHHTDVVSGIGFHGDDVSLLQGQVVHVVIISLAGMFELNFHQVSSFCIARHIGQPVVGVQLTILTAYSMFAESSVAACHYI